MDVMKVGKSLGIGSIGAMANGKITRVEMTDSVTSRITENGNVYSSILTNYYGWKIGEKKHNLQSRITIHAGTRLTHQFLTLTNNPENICTGIVKDKKAVLLMVLTLGILGEATVFQVTSYTPPDNNIFFHSFAFAAVLTLLIPPLKVDLGTGRWVVILSAGVLLWWSGTWWKYTARVAAKLLPHREQATSGLEPREPWHVAVTPNVDMREKKNPGQALVERKNDSNSKYVFINS